LKVDKVTRMNQVLKQKLADSYILDIKTKEEKANNFQISGFSEQIAIDSQQAVKSPQEIMDIFTKATLKIDNKIQITNGCVFSSTSNENNQKLFKLKGTLTNHEDWKLIFSNIKHLNDTNLYLDKSHSPDVQAVLTDFRKKLSLEKQKNKDTKATLKNMTLQVDGVYYEVFNVLRSKFLKDMDV
jgi:hypothetical protein